jgi:hypothetical protein
MTTQQMMLNDNYNIDETFHYIKKLLNEAEPDLYKFIGRTRNKKASKRARKNISMAGKLVHVLLKNIVKQRHDNDNQYKN